MIFGEDEGKNIEAGYDQEINITTSMGRNDGFTLKKDHFASLRHEGILSRQGCTPVRLHTHKTTHLFSCTPVASLERS